MRGELPNALAAMRKILIFRLGGQSYGIRLDAIQEILLMPWLARPPGMPEMLAGVLDLRGRAVPVVRLAVLFGMNEESWTLYTPLVLLRAADLPLGIVVDAVENVVTLDDSSIAPLGENFCVNDCAEGLAMVGQRTVVLLCSQRLLREQELLRIRELAAAEQARLERLQEIVA